MGTDHTLQESDAPDSGLRDLLVSIQIAHRVVLVAEETKTSADVLTFGRKLVGNERWLSIDMTVQLKKDAGIFEIYNSSRPEQDPVTGFDIRVNPYHRKSEAIRENYWLDGISRWCEERHISEGTIVLVCGDNHVEFIVEKLSARGHTVAVERYLPFDKTARFGPFWVYED